MTKEISTTPINKKEIRKQLSDKLEVALLELKELLGDKKFHNRIKKAVKVLTAGLEEKNTEEEEEEVAAVSKKPKAVAPKKTVTNKKAPVKKVVVAKKVAAPKKIVEAKKAVKSVVAKKAIKTAVK